MKESKNEKLNVELLDSLIRNVIKKTMHDLVSVADGACSHKGEKINFYMNVSINLLVAMVNYVFNDENGNEIRAKFYERIQKDVKEAFDYALKVYEEEQKEKKNV